MRIKIVKICSIFTVLMISIFLFPRIYICAHTTETKTVYVVSSKFEDNLETKYSYNKDGLLKKWIYANGNYGEEYVYKNGRIVKATKGVSDSGRFTENWLYDDGRLSDKEILHQYQYYETTCYDKSYQTYVYNKKGQIEKIYLYTDRNGSDEMDYSYNKKGQIIKKTYKSNIHTSRDIAYVYEYKYDKKGNIKSLKDSTNSLGKNEYQLTYKNGRVIKQVITNMPETENNRVTKVFKYKKMQVPKKYADLIKQQQWEIVNGNLIL